MRSAKSLLLVISGVAICSCAFVSSVNMKEAEIHYQAAHNYEAQGDFASAREQYWKAFVAARSGGAKPEVISMLAYEFGRITGYTCHLDESEEFLMESLRLEEGFSERNSRNKGIRYFELARLMYDQNRYKEAANFYSKALREVESKNSLEADPIAFAGVYEEYGDALARSEGEVAAQEARRKARNLREKYPDRQAKFKPVRYKCDIPSLTHQSTGTR
jgi:tetratricopeptide (TPR) repeat protein